jgi:galactokinase
LGIVISAYASGRVNLIGEHTDYNDGFVLPVALARGTTVQLQTRDDAERHVRSPDGDAAPYAAALPRDLPGFDAEATTTLPVGAGLASSASLLVALLRALRPDDAPLDHALVAHRAEAETLGVRCGVMDHLAVALGREGEPLLIDCRTLEATPVVLDDDAELLVLDSGLRHANATAGYQRRRDECDEACRRLGVAALRDLDAVPTGLPAPLDRRVRHVVEENGRVLAAARDPGRLPELMRASHASQRDLYEVSVPEVDRIVELAEGHGALGARLTGGGFGGCVVALCRRGEARAVGERVARDYPAARLLIA